MKANGLSDDIKPVDGEENDDDDGGGAGDNLWKEGVLQG